MARAHYTRARELEASTAESPGPAAYYNKLEVQQSPLRGGIKFALAKKPPSLFDIPADRVCPGPGAYDTHSAKKLGVAEYRSVRSSIVSPSGAVATPTTRPVGPPPSQFPTSAARRLATAAATAAPNNDSAQLSDISQASASADHVLRDVLNDSRSFNSFGPADIGVDPKQVDAPTLGKIRSRLLANTYTRPGQQSAAHRASLFAAADKNHDGYLDVLEVLAPLKPRGLLWTAGIAGIRPCARKKNAVRTFRSFFRRYLKFNQEELSDAQIQLVFSGLARGQTRLDQSRFFALLGPAEDLPPPAARGGRAAPAAGAHPSASPVKAPAPKKAKAVAAAQGNGPAAGFAVRPRAAPAPAAAPLPEAASGSAKKKAIDHMIEDVQRLHGDFDSQLDELGAISKVLDQLLSSMPSPALVAANHETSVP
jgi:hypothetical protein